LQFAGRFSGTLFSRIGLYAAGAEQQERRVVVRPDLIQMSETRGLSLDEATEYTWRNAFVTGATTTSCTSEAQKGLLGLKMLRHLMEQIIGKLRHADVELALFFGVFEADKCACSPFGGRNCNRLSRTCLRALNFCQRLGRRNSGATQRRALNGAEPEFNFDLIGVASLKVV
jgi:hypothetical protein